MSLKKLALWGSSLCLLAAGALVYFPGTNSKDQSVSGQTDETISVVAEEGQSRTLSSEAPDTDSNNPTDEEEVVRDTGPWVSQASTELSSELYDFIEAEQLRYVDISTYPFDPQTEKLLRKLSQTGEIMLFDNTEADRLGGLSETPSDIIADYYGTAAEADVIVATSVKTADGGINFMVLPVAKKEESNSLPEDIKVAVALLKQEKANKEMM
ncbi:hypothetical protein BTA51_20555 [Hahella sp. CCB-MM4]|uniref:hypothetical protein n=1 Tax=Hahella sp. (strain CCB-MM4) TaxID=1926491 RepID=UPI000B9C0CCF|nr:hypothetical protein [Hahella sp. CCB-MM4]OZG71347.1 hypothetical protein BTA51_20555 [Hahella sp. CCB-MM4]